MTFSPLAAQNHRWVSARGVGSPETCSSHIWLPAAPLTCRTLRAPRLAGTGRASSGARLRRHPHRLWPAGRTGQLGEKQSLAQRWSMSLGRAGAGHTLALAEAPHSAGARPTTGSLTVDRSAFLRQQQQVESPVPRPPGPAPYLLAGRPLQQLRAELRALPELPPPEVAPGLEQRLRLQPHPAGRMAETPAGPWAALGPLLAERLRGGAGGGAGPQRRKRQAPPRPVRACAPHRTGRAGGGARCSLREGSCVPLPVSWTVWFSFLLSFPTCKISESHLEWEYMTKKECSLLILIWVKSSLVLWESSWEEHGLLWSSLAGSISLLVH